MTSFLALISSLGLGKYLIAIIGAVTAILGYGYKRKRDGRLEAERRMQEEQARVEEDTRKRVRASLDNKPADADDARERLRNRKRDK